MQISSALLRSLSIKGWDKPLPPALLTSNVTARTQEPLFKGIASADKTCPEPSMATETKQKPSRVNADAPEHTNQFVNASTTPLRDRRLTSTAKCLLLMIKALAGKANSIDLITKGQLAGIIGKSRRTVQYALHELQAFGYLGLETVKGYFGLYAGLRITIGMMTKPFSPSEFYQKAADKGQKVIKPAFSDRQVAAQQITRYKYLEKKAADIRLQGWLFSAQNE